MTWRTLVLDVRSGLFIPRLVTWDPETGKFTCVEGAEGVRDVGGGTMLTELLAFLDELLSYLESVRDVRGEDGRPARRSPEIERLTQKTRALRDAVSVERQKT